MLLTRHCCDDLLLVKLKISLSLSLSFSVPEQRCYFCFTLNNLKNYFWFSKHFLFGFFFAISVSLRSSWITVCSFSLLFFLLFSLVRRTKNSVESNFDLLCWRLFLIGHVFHFIDFWTPTNGLDTIYSSLFVICSSTFTRSHYPRFCFCISINYRLNTNHLTAPCT